MFCMGKAFVFLKQLVLKPLGQEGKVAFIFVRDAFLGHGVFPVASLVYMGFGNQTFFVY